MRGKKRASAEQLEERHERRVVSLERLHTSLRNATGFQSRKHSAEGFWASKDKKPDEDAHGNPTYPLDGWARSLAEWSLKHNDPQTVDICAIAAECHHFNLDDSVRVQQVANDARERLEARFAERSKPLSAVVE